jgi:hypothetical protein
LNVNIDFKQIDRLRLDILHRHFHALTKRSLKACPDWGATPGYFFYHFISNTQLLSRGCNSFLLIVSLSNSSIVFPDWGAN